MNSKIIFFAVTLFALTACGGKTNHNHGTHIHEDGTVHQNHSTEAETSTNQESFKVEADSTIIEVEHHHDHEHNHDHNHPHQH